jgi:hypothetical protein
MTKAIISNKFGLFAILLAVLFSITSVAFAYDNLSIVLEVKKDNTVVYVDFADEDDDEVSDEYGYDTTNLRTVYKAILADLQEDHQIDGLTADEIKKIAKVVTDKTAQRTITDTTAKLKRATTYVASLKEDVSDLEEDLEEANSILEDAKEAYADEEYVEATQKAEEVMSILTIILGEDKKTEVKKEKKDDTNFCENTDQAAGLGVAKKCVGEENYSINEKLGEKVERFQDRAMSKYEKYGQSTDKDELQNQLRELLLVLIELLQKQKDAQTQ